MVLQRQPDRALSVELARLIEAVGETIQEATQTIVRARETQDRATVLRSIARELRDEIHSARQRPS